MPLSSFKKCYAPLKRRWQERRQRQEAPRPDTPEETKERAPGTGCALVIGHSQSRPGARNKDHWVDEYSLNKKMAKKIVARVGDRCPIWIMERGDGPQAYSKLPAKINETEPAVIVSLHLNAFNTKASGTEVLYYHRSQKGEQAARILQRHLVGAMGLPDRGIKPRSAEDRGGYLLAYTKSVALISEAFFLDNNADLARFMERETKLINAFADAIVEMHNMLTKKAAA